MLSRYVPCSVVYILWQNLAKLSNMREKLLAAGCFLP
jgi:hypothetical protein